MFLSAHGTGWPSEGHNDAAGCGLYDWSVAAGRVSCAPEGQERDSRMENGGEEPSVAGRPERQEHCSSADGQGWKVILGYGRVHA